MMTDSLDKSRTMLSRRDLLWKTGGGLGGVALSTMLGGKAGASTSDTTTLATAGGRHHAPRAKRVIQIFCPGGLSHIDTFDYKPELEKRAGTPFDPGGKLQFFASKPGAVMPSQWKFHQHGESGLWMSDLMPNLATCIDDMAFIYSMQSKTALHGPGCFFMNTGFTLPGFPSMGSWVTYGLGSESENLPAFVVLPDPRGLPPGGPINWGAGFLPAVHQGTTMSVQTGEPPLSDLFPPKDFAGVNQKSDQAGLAFLRSLNEKHRDQRAGNSELDARIAAYEMAARLQLSAPEATDLKGESPATQKLYALDDPDIGPFGRQCLLARRLVERGTRFVQIFCGAENTTAREIRPNWDSHEDVPRDHGYWGRVLDVGAAALLKDLKSRGMLDETLVICSTEFGRQPAAQMKGKTDIQTKGRDHNAGAFTAWMAGGGIKGGVGYGATDELGWKAEIRKKYCYDLHATALHLLGIDHERLTYYNNGIERRLTDVHGRVIDPLLA